MWFSVVETLAFATGISVALLGGMPGSATPEYSGRVKSLKNCYLPKEIVEYTLKKEKGWLTCFIVVQ